ncbi:hypothetical protein J2X06_002599 [Lysobacter niastensis]|uniref:Uncharacterized protein n=1 Tax=Lysobacter niastensis TaxID=380629 RepID=A0ABU1WD99_9GAMM|nr:hypothetical protein [Lysobacter niastensis]
MPRCGERQYRDLRPGGEALVALPRRGPRQAQVWSARAEKQRATGRQCPGRERPLLMKDIVLLAVSIYPLKEDVQGLQAKANP